MSRLYDDAVNIFTPNGHLRQVEYAQALVKHCSTVAALRSKNCIVLGAEKKPMHALQRSVGIKKIVKLDNHVVMTFAGLTADARVLTKFAQEEAQGFRRNFDCPASVEHIARYVGTLKQQFTQNRGRRPFGLSCLIAGFDLDGQPHLYQTDPSGVYHEWVATSTGRKGGKVLQNLEKFSVNMINNLNEDGAIQLLLRSLVLPTFGNANFYEIAVLKHQQQLQMINPLTIIHMMRTILLDHAAMEG